MHKEIRPGRFWETHTSDNVRVEILRVEPETCQARLAGSTSQTRVYFRAQHRPTEELWCWAPAFESRYVPAPE
jgi:hypothetical protein